MGFSVDVDAIVINCNKTASTKLGYKKDELIGQSVFSIYHPDYLEKAKNTFQRFVRTGELHDVEMIFKRKDTRNIAVSISASAVRNEKGDILYGTLQCRDITKRFQMRQKLLAVEAELRNTINISPGLICVADVNSGYFTECNPAVSRLLGFSIEEFKSRPFTEFIHPDDIQKSVDERTKLLSGSQVANFENRYLCKDGSYKWLAWQATAADEFGKVVTVATDISDLKKREAEAALSHSLLEATLESTADGILVISLEGKWTRSNQKFINMWGIPECISTARDDTKVLDYILESLVEPGEFIANVSELSDDPAKVSFGTITKKNGQIFELSCYPQLLKDEVVGRVFNFRDITAQVKMSEKLTAQAFEMKQLVKRLLNTQEDERRRIAQELHDEVGQVTTALGIFLGELRAGEMENVAPRYQKCIVESISLVEEMDSQLHRLAFDIRPLMLDELGLQPTIRWFTEQFCSRTGLECEIISKGNFPKLSKDLETSLFRIMQESFTNISRHANATKISVTLDSNNESVWLTIQDDGTGFDVNLISSDIERGTGLGIPGMRERVDQFAGKLIIQSKPGTGTLVKVQIPVDGSHHE